MSTTQPKQPEKYISMNVNLSTGPAINESNFFLLCGDFCNKCNGSQSTNKFDPPQVS